MASGCSLAYIVTPNHRWHARIFGRILTSYYPPPFFEHVIGSGSTTAHAIAMRRTAVYCYGPGPPISPDYLALSWCIARAPRAR
eukprot:8277238-Pyramimonas_sp.AAC.1